MSLYTYVSPETCLSFPKVAITVHSPILNIKSHRHLQIIVAEPGSHIRGNKPGCRDGGGKGTQGSFDLWCCCYAETVYPYDYFFLSVSILILHCFP